MQIMKQMTAETKQGLPPQATICRANTWSLCGWRSLRALKLRFPTTVGMAFQAEAQKLPQD